MIGIYQLRNITNGKCYVGQSKNISHRISCHRYDLKNNKHRIVELQRDYNNGDEIVSEVIAECAVDDLAALERYFIKIYTSKGISYNVSPGVSKTGGNEWVDESRKKLSESKMGNTSMVGVKLSDEWRKHLAEAQPHSRKVECLDTGIIYDSVTDAARQTGLRRTKITAVCKGRAKTTGGMRFAYVS